MPSAVTTPTTPPPPTPKERERKVRSGTHLLSTNLSLMKNEASPLSLAEGSQLRFFRAELRGCYLACHLQFLSPRPTPGKGKAPLLRPASKARVWPRLTSAIRPRKMETETLTRRAGAVAANGRPCFVLFFLSVRVCCSFSSRAGNV